MAEADITGLSPEAHVDALARFRELRAGRPLTPGSLMGTLCSHNWHGGATSSGAAFGQLIRVESYYCEEPSEQDRAVTLLPRAVIEIISKGYEKKDMEISLPFYLTQRIGDIVIFDPSTNHVSHYHSGQTDEYDSPVELTFACGCRATI